jgi:1-aminocyclopropane-1-carboxylate deaminase/D-cysteine desulfhydrase-like pyridoxal-dependent ACC family enzyme
MNFMPHSRIHLIKSISKPGAQIYIKRDDELGFGITGTKLRKYQSLLYYIKNQGIKHAVLIGGAYSNNIVSLSQLLIEQGVVTHLFLRGDRVPAYKGNFLLTSLLIPSERIYWLKRDEWEKAESQAQALARKLPSPSIVIPEGACMIEALPGSLSLGTDILRNEQEHNLLFDHIFIEAGTGLAAIGLILGFKIYRKTAQIHILLLADNKDGFLKKLESFYQHLFSKYQVKIDWDELIQGIHFYHPSTAPSFGTTNKQVFDAIIQIARQDGILTDPIYSAKLLMTAKHTILTSEMVGNILIIHSGGGLALMGFQEQLANQLQQIIGRGNA